MSEERLAVFLELNGRGKKAPWQERIKLVESVFPGATALEWNKAFNDISLFGRVVRDILKADQAEAGRSGPRKNLERDPALLRLREFMGKDYTELPFAEALRQLSGPHGSVRSIANKTGLNRMFIQRLLDGRRSPDVPTLEIIARAYRKDPGYFVEYRVAYILAALGDKLSIAPETNVGLYRRIKGED